MKKLLAIIPAAALALSAFTTMGAAASAACAGKHGVSSYRTSSARNFGSNFDTSSTLAVNAQKRALHYFIDSNNDGICDNCTDGICMQNGLCSSYFHERGVFIDNNNDGICDNYAAGICTQHGNHHMGGNFIDNNNDGICDNCADGVCTQHGNHHMGGNFIDNNNDGICDNCADGVCTQYGNHHMSGNFIDNNNDGICDNCADGVCTQHGTGLGQHRGKGCHR